MALRYVGAALGYIHGVPARDLTDEEEAQFGAAIAEQEKATGWKLYERFEPVKTNKAAKADPEKEGA